MERDPTLIGEVISESRRVAAVRHRFRNQFQQMTSLVSLFGRRLPLGQGREALEDMRARFEAINAVDEADESLLEGALLELALGDLARRIISHLDPKARHSIAVDGAAARVSVRSATPLAQLLAEMAIDLVRNGFGSETPGTGEIWIGAAADGGLSLRASQTSDPPPRSPAPDGGLGVALAESFARNLGGTFARDDAGRLVVEATIPPPVEGR